MLERQITAASWFARVSCVQSVSLVFSHVHVSAGIGWNVGTQRMGRCFHVTVESVTAARALSNAAKMRMNSVPVRCGRMLVGVFGC